MIQGVRLFMNNFASQAGGPDRRNRVALAEACEVARKRAMTRLVTWPAMRRNPRYGGAWGRRARRAPAQWARALARGSLTYSVGGFAAGLDRRLTPNLLAGVALGYTTGTQWMSGFDGRGSTDTFLASLYSNFREGPIYVDGIAGYAYSNNQMWRAIAIPGLQPRTALGQTGANQFYGQVESGLPLRHRRRGRDVCYAVRPSASLHSRPERL